MHSFSKELFLPMPTLTLIDGKTTEIYSKNNWLEQTLKQLTLNP